MRHPQRGLKVSLSAGDLAGVRREDDVPDMQPAGEQTFEAVIRGIKSKQSREASIVANLQD